MENRNVKEAILALTQKPLFSTSVERVLILNEIKGEYKDLPQPLRFAKFLEVLLSRVSTPIEEGDLIVGRCVDRELTEEEERVFQEYNSSPDNPRNDVIIGTGHCTLSWETLVKEGIVGLKRRAQKGLKGANEEKRNFILALISVYDSVIAFIKRYADEAERAKRVDLVESLTEIATAKPKSFKSALQLLWIVTLIECAYLIPNPTLTVGRLDKILYPLYKNDVKNGRLTKEEASAYVTDYYCKHNLIMGRGEHQVGDESNSTTFARICNFDAPQYLLLAGTDERGKSAVNELTEIFAESIVPQFKNPVIVVRYHKGMDVLYPRLWKTLCKKAIDSASMMFYNDDTVLSTYKRLGFSRRDRVKYEHFGCNWPTTGDNGSWMQGGPKSRQYGVYLSEKERKELDVPFMRTNSPLGWVEDVMAVFRELSKEEQFTTDDIYERFLKSFSLFIDRKLEHLSKELKARQRKPSACLTFDDCFHDEVIKKAQCHSACAKYHFELQGFFPFANVVDSIIAVEKIVINEKKITLSRLLEAVDADFNGYDAELALCKGADKYGMDTETSNAHAQRLAQAINAIVIEKSKPYLKKQGLFLAPCMQSDTWHLKYGENYGATPDGRRAKKAFSQNTRPSNGSCLFGLTAMLKSTLLVTTSGLLSGALNLDIDKKQFSGEEGLCNFCALLSAYFNEGGLHAQVTSVTREDLINAQIKPDEYRDLRVRVTGYSGVFTDICKKLQDDIIERLE